MSSIVSEAPAEVVPEVSPNVFAIVDCNNFYASCERLFAPHLIGQPIVVLSNNDGCVIARSDEVKALGVEMGVAYFKARRFLEQEGIAVFSSNYALYGDLSQRVMEVLSQFTPTMEIYSIDEAFLDLSGFEHLGMSNYAQQIRQTVEQWTGIPVSIGIAPTKTLAKIANRVCKKDPAMQGVMDLTNPEALESVLSMVVVQDVWGVGRRLSKQLNAEGIYTALDLSRKDTHDIKQRYSVVLARTVDELKGYSCLDLETIVPDRQQVLCSRSFGMRVTQEDDMRHALGHFASRAAEKLRKQNLIANALNIHISTSPFDGEVSYNNSITMKLPFSTDDTRLLSAYAQDLLSQIFKPGLSYQRGGVLLMDLEPYRHAQYELFEDKQRSGRSDSLMKTLDLVNQKMGSGALQLGRGDFDDSDWRMRQRLKSPSYTTQIKGLKAVS